jgi:hypothetical protein
MTWLTVFSACIAAVLIANAVTAVVVALVIGIKTSQQPANPVRMAFEKQPEYPVDENGNLKGMESESGSESESGYEEGNVRL